MLMNVDGTLTENTGAFATAYEKEAKENNRLHVFVAEVDGEKICISRLRCWPLGCYLGICCAEQRQGYRLRCLFFPCQRNSGSGCRNRKRTLPGEFPGKKTLENGEIALGVVKNGKVEKADYQVDGISGGTITSVGVDAMLKACLSSYKNFLTNNNEEE